jgi:hypothetical protein
LRSIRSRQMQRLAPRSSPRPPAWALFTDTRSAARRQRKPSTTSSLRSGRYASFSLPSVANDFGSATTSAAIRGIPFDAAGPEVRNPFTTFGDFATVIQRCKIPGFACRSGSPGPPHGMRGVLERVEADENGRMPGNRDKVHESRRSRRWRPEGPPEMLTFTRIG